MIQVEGQPADPWEGRQPRYEKIVRRKERRLELLTKLPSGEPIAVPIVPFAIRTISGRGGESLLPRRGAM